MRLNILIGLVFINFSVLTAQIDNRNVQVELDPVEDDFKDPGGVELPALKQPSLSNYDPSLKPNTNLEIADDEDKVDFTQGDGLMDYTSNIVPKAFKKDKKAKEEFGRDQFLGTVATSGGFVMVKYRDHEFVDGDRIRIFMNGDVIKSEVSLGGSFKGFTLTLDEGNNQIVFQALNQGSSGPNTAELHVYNDKGQLISAAEWNLLTGNKATIEVLKQ
ncbi:MAG: hypothetical protein HKP11_01710 [Flavobacteriaceae bacterium]|nr:hypothetical protein [Flavobacteriaceae bacterium]